LRKQISQEVHRKSEPSSRSTGEESHATAFARGRFITCVLAASFFVLAAHRTSLERPSSGPTDGYRFKILDAQSELPVPDAAVSLTYVRKQEAIELKKEIEVKADKHGLAEFPRLEAAMLMVSVTAVGYRSYWRWIRPEDFKQAKDIRLEKWGSARK
jgi:hypothetical protein